MIRDKLTTQALSNEIKIVIFKIIELNWRMNNTMNDAILNQQSKKWFAVNFFGFSWRQWQQPTGEAKKTVGFHNRIVKKRPSWDKFWPSCMIFILTKTLQNVIVRFFANLFPGVSVHVVCKKQKNTTLFIGLWFLFLLACFLLFLLFLLFFFHKQKTEV